MSYPNDQPERELPSENNQLDVMVAQQLISRGIADKRVLDAIRHVPRDHFVPESVLSSAFDDHALPIGCGQTISQPYTVAFMCEALITHPTDHVLEVGTGSGYCAAVLSRLVAKVDTVERIPELAAEAGMRLEQLQIPSVSVHVADGTLGLPEAAPFDAIMVTAGGKELPRNYISQLNDGGRIVIPLGGTLQNQTMWRFTRHGDEVHRGGQHHRVAARRAGAL